ncbi:MAG: hypothetical protein GY858_09515 [Candidatus Omnitrophica bacterium]|nr:hypothetical protein [Candidatus Omnitrophota bacterium]
MGQGAKPTFQTEVRTALPTKTVYVFGAGFSYGAGFPLQRLILTKVFSQKFDILYGESLVRRKELREFIDQIFYPNALPSLEDLFTLLDQTIAQRRNCFDYSWKELDSIRDDLKRLILTVFHEASLRSETTGDKFYDSLASHFVKETIKKRSRGNRLSVISLNWDSLLEDSVYKITKKTKNKKQQISTDFCCCILRLKEDCDGIAIPPVNQEEKNRIKILKLHGSINWLFCPNCNRMYTGLGANEGRKLYVQDSFCKHCLGHTVRRKKNKHVLQPYIITPTFEKNFDNIHIRTVWYNAYAELATADRVVFVGYSLPEADYHLRTLLRRAIRPSACIDVVLSPKDKPFYARYAKKRDIAQDGSTTKRYYDFFGIARVKTYFGGTKNYFKKYVIGKN